MVNISLNGQLSDGTVVSTFDDLKKWVEKVFEPQIKNDATVYMDSDLIILKMNTSQVVPIKFGRNGWVEVYSTWAARITKMSPKSMQSLMLCIATGSEL